MSKKTVKPAKSKRLLFIIAGVLVLVIGCGGAFFFMNGGSGSIGGGGTGSFKTVCTDKSDYYTDLCDNVGSYAQSLYTVDPVNNTTYGKITGVAWRRVGNIISRPNETKRYAPGNDYYYIICPEYKTSYCMLQIHSEIRPVTQLK